MQQPMYPPMQPMGYAQPEQGMSGGMKLLLGAVVLAVLYYAYTTMSKPAVAAPTPGGNGSTAGSSGGASSGTTSGSSGSKPVQPAGPKWNYKGCYVDNGGHRGLPDMMGVLDFNGCQSAAAAKGYNTMGLQFHDGYVGTQTSQCWGGKDSVYDALGPAGNCSFNDAGGNLHGGFDSNAIYKLE